LLERKDWQRNQFLSIFAFVLLWDVHFTYAIERWREENGHAILDWMDSVGQLEALAALAGYAYERPTRPFPEIVESGPVFEGIELGHPLIAEEEVVPNSVSLGESPRALIVSGSNMSGKSTLLRTVGINAILALAGAPVCATSLRISPLSLGATLRVQDSIQSGTSRFYAEIKKLKQLTAMAESGTSLLFLLDELFSGTNSHDREIGANALLKGLLEAGAVGLVTTHDLALTKAGGADGAPIQNVHFEDHLEGDRLVFDYQMRPGIVTKSNALALMRAVGLKV
jgi:DNA mismatch repair ATPase MutS